MKNIIKIILALFILVVSLQAKEKTLEEQVAEALKNSEIFVKKAGQFEKDFAGENGDANEQTELNYCKDVIYPPTAELFVKYSCKAIQDMNWNELYCFSAKDYLDELQFKVDMIKNNITRHEKKFKAFTCKIKSSKQTDEFWEEKEFTLEKMGTIKIDFKGDWKIIDLELN